MTPFNVLAAWDQAVRMRAALALLTDRPRLLVASMGSTMLMNLGWKDSGPWSAPSVFTVSSSVARYSLLSSAPSFASGGCGAAGHGVVGNLSARGSPGLA